MKNLFLLLFLFCCSMAVFSQKILPPQNGCYHAAFVGNDSQKMFEDLAKKAIAFEMIFTGWPSNKVPDFPLTKCNTIVAGGALPHITWMCQVSGSPYPLDAILNGSFDSYLSGYAAQVKAFGLPVFIRLGHEMNGDWYTYGGAKNGGGTLSGYGDPAKADGPERFIDVFRKVVTMFNSLGVTNVTWVWAPNNGSSPNEAWNQPEDYYPGDEYVDWIGFDGYNFGISQTWSGWTSFRTVFDGLYTKFKDYGKPIMLAEFASVENGGNKNLWINDLFLYTKYLYKNIKAITWFHVKKYEGTVLTDWSINSSPQALLSYQNGVADSYFLSSIITSAKEEISQLPEAFSLSQNYPNPFNPETTIQYAVASNQHVSLKVCDILGKEVATLVNEDLKAGNYSVDFDASHLVSGIYFYQLHAGEFIAVKKLVLLK